jgi:alpha-mannosidase
LEAAGARVEVADDGTLSYTASGVTRHGLLGLVDRGDRGDTYDSDVLDDEHRLSSRAVDVVRRQHPVGLGDLTITRTYLIPESMLPSREDRSAATTELTLVTVVRLSPDGRLDIDVRCSSSARDHRVQLRMPVGAGVAEHAVTFGHEVLGDQVNETANWVHPAPTTFCHQGWVARSDCLLLAPGLPEAELEDGAVLITLMRAVGWMSRPDLRTRPGRASPAIPVPGAQCPDGVTARIALLPDPVDQVSRWAALESFELAPVVVAAGDLPVLAADTPFVEVTDAVMTAMKPGDDGEGVAWRLWNPTETTSSAQLRIAVSALELRECELDETRSRSAAQPHLSVVGGLNVDLGSHQLITVRGSDHMKVDEVELRLIHSFADQRE